MRLLVKNRPKEMSTTVNFFFFSADFQQEQHCYLLGHLLVAQPEGNTSQYRRHIAFPIASLSCVSSLYLAD